MNQLVCIRSFVKVADLGSFTAAAAVLRLSRATISCHVAQLEAHLHCPLLERSTRRVDLTAAGAEYLLRSREILASLASADLAAQRGR
jgi:LysR family transcriptional regulator for bpeEF and oprC